MRNREANRDMHNITESVTDIVARSGIRTGIAHVFNVITVQGEACSCLTSGWAICAPSALRGRSESSAATRQRTENKEPDGSEDGGSTTLAQFRLKLLPIDGSYGTPAPTGRARWGPCSGTSLSLSLSLSLSPVPMMRRFFKFNSGFPAFNKAKGRFLSPSIPQSGSVPRRLSLLHSQKQIENKEHRNVICLDVDLPDLWGRLEGKRDN